MKGEMDRREESQKVDELRLVLQPHKTLISIGESKIGKAINPQTQG